MDEAKPAPATKQRSEWRETSLFLIKLVIAILILRSFIFSPFNIPSASMLPRLLVGDYLFITKWDYGYSRYSLPFGVPLIPDRIFPSTPERGDVVVFKKPPENNADWIKRVIGLPGDTIRMQAGQIYLNGAPVPKQRIADFVVPITPNFPVARDGAGGSGCEQQFVASAPDGLECRYPQFRETLPNGKSYNVLDQGMNIGADETDLYTVPEGHVFLMGDNRDDSTDSRFSQGSGGIGFAPIENVQGRAAVIFWSTDGTASWLLPWTWFTAARWDRIGEGF